MAREERKRPQRIPLSPEEVAQLILIKKRTAARKLESFKRSRVYSFYNIFNVCCFFVYWELLLCFLGPCHYQTHYSKSVRVKRGEAVNTSGRRVATEVTLISVDDKVYQLMVNDFIESPEKYYPFQIGKDYILQKELKGITRGAQTAYRIEAASPLIFLSLFVIFVSCICFFYNLNENPDSLRAVAILNLLTLLAFIAI